MAVKKATPENSKYNRKKYVKNGSGKDAIKTARELYAKHKDKPTTAAADPNLRLPEALMQVDPAMISQVLPNMYRQFMSIRNLMNAFNSTNNNSSPQGYIQTTLVNVFYGALAILIKEFSYNKVLKVLFAALSDDKYLIMTQQYQEIVFESIIKIIQKAKEEGETNIPVSDIPSVIYGTAVPTTVLSSYDEVPDFYVQQYYTAANDPYPGYIKFSDSTDLYVKRTLTDYPYESAEDEIRITAEYALARELSGYIKEETLTITVLYALLQVYCQTVLDNNLEKNAGKNSKQNLLSMLTMFAGLAGTMGQLVQNQHLPQSVLNVSSMSKTIDEHIQNIGKIKKLKGISQTAFDPAMLLNSGLLSSLSSIFKGKSSTNSQQISSIANTIIKGLT